MYFSTLSEWLKWIESIHFSSIDLGLERVRDVAHKLQLLPEERPVITVAGTNGKGSTIAALEAIYRESGYAVGSYTSPILYKHNEQIRINGVSPSDEDFCEIYRQIESGRDEITLTPFEYHTLAALLIFKKYSLDILLLEVGMGGRLDAVNIVDANVAIITSIDIDHAEWLGNTREQISLEKAGIFRMNHPVICGDFNPPQNLIDYAKSIKAPFYQQEIDFHFITHDHGWDWACPVQKIKNLPMASLVIQNLSAALMAIVLLQNRLPVPEKALRQAFADISLPGRLQIIDGSVQQIFDVAHNPAAIAYLASVLNQIPHYGKTFAVFSMLADKDIGGSIQKIKHLIDEWYIAPLHTARAAENKSMRVALTQAEARGSIIESSTILEAYKTAMKKAVTGDRIIIFGSFHTVAQAKSQ